jgi:hypothetical protein
MWIMQDNPTERIQSSSCKVAVYYSLQEPHLDSSDGIRRVERSEFSVGRWIGRLTAGSVVGLNPREGFLKERLSDYTMPLHRFGMTMNERHEEAGPTALVIY